MVQLVKNPSAMWGDLGSIPGLGRTSGEGKGYPLQYSGLENSMDYIVHEVIKSWTRLSDFHFTSLHYHEYPRILLEFFSSSQFYPERGSVMSDSL